MSIFSKIKKIFDSKPVPGDILLPNTPVNSADISKAFGESEDFVIRDITLGGGERTVKLAFLDGVVSGIYVSDQIIRPITDPVRFGPVTSDKEALDLMLAGSVYGITAYRREKSAEIIEDMLSGFCCAIFDELGEGISFEMRSIEKRSIAEPKEEKVVKGAKDAFIEIVRSNTALVRRRIKNPALRIKEVTVGRKTATRVSIVWIDGFTNGEIVAELERRVRKITVDGVLTSSVIEENLSDRPRSIFPQVITTERPDKFCMNLLEGRAGLLVDGLPIGYLVPGTFTQFFKVPEDSAHHIAVSTILTTLRYLSLFVTLLLPALYVAVSMFHQEMLPTKLMQSIIDAKQSVPFPTALEVLAMLIAFELLQEAGLRLPSPIGQTISIIGALIVGQSAVDAKVVSPVVVIVVAFAGICGYTVPNQDMAEALRVCRFLFVLAAIFAGMFGLAIASALMLYVLCSMESLGVPYMTPFAGTVAKNIKYAFVRKPVVSGDSAECVLRTGENDEED